MDKLDLINITDKSPQEIIADLEHQIAAYNQQLAEKKEATAKFNLQLDTALHDISQAAMSTEDLRTQYEQILAKLQQSRQAQRDFLHSSPQQKAAEEDEAMSKREQISARIMQAQQEYITYSTQANELSANFNAILSDYNFKQNQLTELKQEQEKRHQLLNNEHLELCRRLSDMTQSANNSYSEISIAKEVAQKSYDLTTQSLAETASAIADLEQDILKAEEELQQYINTELDNIDSLGHDFDKEIETCINEAEQAAQEKSKYHKELDKLLALKETSGKLYNDSQKNLEELSKRISSLVLLAQQESEEISARFDAAMQQTSQDRANHKNLLTSWEFADNEHYLAAEKESSLRQKLQQLRAENLDLQNSILVTTELINDAAESKSNATEDLLPAILEMESTLQKAIEDARQQAKAKEKEILRTAQSLLNATENTKEKLQSVNDIKNELAKAELICITSEQTTLDIINEMQEAQQNPDRLSVQIANLRNEYKAAFENSSQLKDADIITGDQIRATRLAMEKAAARHNNNITKSAELLPAKDKAISQRKQAYELKLSDMIAQLDMMKKKHDRLSESAFHKQTELEKYAADLAALNEKLEDAQRNYDDCRLNESNTVEQSKNNLEKQLHDDEGQLVFLQNEVNSSLQKHNNYLEKTSKIEVEIQKLHNNLMELQQEEQKLHQEQALARSCKENSIAAELAIHNDNCLNYEAQAEALAEALQHSINEEEQLRHKPAQLRAELELSLQEVTQIEVQINELYQRIHEQEDLYQAAKAAAEQAQIAAEQERIAAEQKAIPEAERAKRYARLQEERKKRLEQAQRIAQEAQEAAQAALQQEKEAAIEAAAIEKRTADLLSKSDKQALLDQADIEEYINQLAFRAAYSAADTIATDDSNISDNEADDTTGIKNYTLESAASRDLFGATRATLYSLRDSILQLKKEKAALCVQNAQQMLKRYNLQNEQEIMLASSKNLHKLSSLSGSTMDAGIKQTLTDLQSSIDTNKNAINSCTMLLEENGAAIDGYTRNIADSEATFNELLDQLYDITCKWIYNESKSDQILAKVETQKQEEICKAISAEQNFADNKQEIAENNATPIAEAKDKKNKLTSKASRLFKRKTSN